MAASLVARKQAFLHHLRGKQNYQVLFFIVQTSDRIYVIFAPFKLTYKSAVFYRIIIEYKLTSSILRTIKARASLPHHIKK